MVVVVVFFNFITYHGLKLGCFVWKQAGTGQKHNDIKNLTFEFFHFSQSNPKYYLLSFDSFVICHLASF